MRLREIKNKLKADLANIARWPHSPNWIPRLYNSPLKIAKSELPNIPLKVKEIKIF